MTVIGIIGSKMTLFTPPLYTNTWAKPKKTLWILIRFRVCDAHTSCVAAWYIHFPTFYSVGILMAFLKKNTRHTHNVLTVEHNTLQDRVLSSYEGSCRRQLRYHQWHQFFRLGWFTGFEIFFYSKKYLKVLGRVWGSKCVVNGVILHFYWIVKYQRNGRKTTL